MMVMMMLDDGDDDDDDIIIILKGCTNKTIQSEILLNPRTLEAMSKNNDDRLIMITVD